MKSLETTTSEELKTNVLEFAKQFFSSSRKFKLMELSAIWLEKPLRFKTSNYHIAFDVVESRRITKDIFVTIEDSKLIDMPKLRRPTHQITKCLGNLHSTILQIEVRNLQTKEIETIVIK